MTRHYVNVVLTAVFGTVVFFAFWWLIADLLLKTIPQLLHSPAETAFGALVVLIIAIAALSGILVDIQLHQHETPRRHHFRFLHPRLHH
ncbi:MAG TPA: hypothetical protein VHD85_17060 [Terracidiphilus sp.]|nr:hypothetical protein [Terracidiphilus sp.]